MKAVVTARDELLTAASRARTARAALLDLPSNATDAQRAEARAAVRRWEDAEGQAMARLQAERSRQAA